MTLSLLVVGARGQLGRAVIRETAGTGAEVRALSSADLDLRDPDATRAAVLTWATSAAASGTERLVVVNAAAYTDVDAAEGDQAAAFALNAEAPAGLAAACAQVGARLVHVSTDYVFPGNATRPYEVDDPTGPRSVYGRSKLAGEQAVRETHPHGSYVVRTAWLYSASAGSFVTTMVRLERERETVTVVDDQRGSPTWARDLAVGLLDLAASDAQPGVYHATNAGETTWHGLARAVFEELGADPARVLPTSAQAFGRVAPRPSYSVLSARSGASAGLAPLQGWRAALAEAFRASRAEFIHRAVS